ncbi:MAG: ABC transporter permease subunit [Zestosphaera sp.]
MLKELALKEIKVMLRDKKILIPAVVLPLIIFVALGGIMRFAMTSTFQEAVKSVTEVNLYVCDLDEGGFTQLMLRSLEGILKSVTLTRECGEDDLRRALSGGQYSIAVLIPPNATVDFSNSIPVRLVVYGKVSGISFTTLGGTAAPATFVNVLSESLRAYLIASGGMNPNFTLTPVRAVTQIVFRNTTMDASTLSNLALSSYAMFFIPVILVSSGLGYATTFMAYENEEKTLEILLSLPVKRRTILLSKVVGVFFLILLSTISFFAGFMFYMTSLFSAIGEAAGGGTSEITPQLSALTSIINPLTILLLVISIVITLLNAAGLGLLLGSISPDVRTAGTYSGPLTMVFIIPSLLLAYVDLTSLGIWGPVLGLMVSPFITPLVVMKAVIEGYEWLAFTSIVFGITTMSLFIYAASKIISSERIFSMQFRISLRRRVRTS